MNNALKTCTGCKREKAVEEFYAKGARCKECTNAQNRAWQEANPEKFQAATRNWRAKAEGHTYLDKKSGYVNYIGYAHPASNPAGITRAHRIVLFDKIGAGSHECHWCKREVFWDKSYPQQVDALVVDHLNGIKNDNRPENLVPACGRCNLTRPGNKKPGKPKTQIGPCSVDGCKNDAKSQFLCSGHYQQQKAGKPFTALRTYQKVEKDEDGKVCTGCDEYKTYENYYKRSGGKGYQNTCKECTKESSRKNTLARLAA